jgi:hypothetical protein
MKDMSDRGGEREMSGKVAAPGPDTDGPHEPDAGARSGAAPAVEPWKKAAIGVLIGYLAFHLIGLAILTIYPVFVALDPEAVIGRAYLDLLGMEVQKIAPWIIAPLLAGTSVASLWGVEMRRRARWLLSLSILGIVFSGLFYAVMAWFDRAIDLWQYEGPPNHDQFVALCRGFSFGNFIVFGGALFGALGARVPDFLGRKAG